LPECRYWLVYFDFFLTWKEFDAINGSTVEKIIIFFLWIIYFLSSLSKLIHSFRILEGLSDDDLRESAYEILLASLAFSG
jgi:hypothetical protein